MVGAAVNAVQELQRAQRRVQMLGDISTSGKEQQQQEEGQQQIAPASLRSLTEELQDTAFGM